MAETLGVLGRVQRGVDGVDAFPDYWLRLGGLPRLVTNRGLVSYPTDETDAEKAARVKSGALVPMVSYVAGRIVF